jgi:putative selenate reductase molybdopterin-binding subunit
VLYERASVGSCLGRRLRSGLGCPNRVRELAAKAELAGVKLLGIGNSQGTLRSIAFNVQGFEVAVHRRYGEIRILRSIHAADAGTVINPMQCRGQVEGGVAQAIGAALYEELMIDGSDKVTNPTFRGCHLPTYADVPVTESISQKLSTGSARLARNQ